MTKKKEEKSEFIEHYISDVLGYFGVKPTVSVSVNEEAYNVNIEGDSLNFLIGYRGDSLDGLQQFLNLSMFAKFSEWSNAVVDINGYRAAKKEKIEEMTKGFIDRVRFFSEEVAMPPMQAYERKQVHEFVSTYADVESVSVGEGYNRHVVLKPLA